MDSNGIESIKKPYNHFVELSLAGLRAEAAKEVVDQDIIKMLEEIVRKANDGFVVEKHALRLVDVIDKLLRNDEKQPHLDIEFQSYFPELGDMHGSKYIRFMIRLDGVVNDVIEFAHMGCLEHCLDGIRECLRAYNGVCMTKRLITMSHCVMEILHSGRTGMPVDNDLESARILFDRINLLCSIASDKKRAEDYRRKSLNAEFAIAGQITALTAEKHSYT